MFYGLVCMFCTIDFWVRFSSFSLIPWMSCAWCRSFISFLCSSCSATHFLTRTFNSFIVSCFLFYCCSNLTVIDADASFIASFLWMFFEEKYGLICVWLNIDSLLSTSSCESPPIEFVRADGCNVDRLRNEFIFDVWFIFSYSMLEFALKLL